MDVWIWHANIEWYLPNELKPKKTRQRRSTIFTVFLIVVVNSDFSWKANKKYYLDVKRLKENVYHKLVARQQFLHHDNASSYIVNEFLAKNSTDLTPVNFFLFPKLKLPRRETCFETIDSIKINSQKELKAISEAADRKCNMNRFSSRR